MSEPATTEPGGNHLGIKLGNRVLNLQSQNLVLIILIVGLAILTYQRNKALGTHLDTVRGELTQMRDTLSTGQLKIADTLHTEEMALREAVQAAHGQLQTALAAWREQTMQTLQTHGDQHNAHMAGINQRLEHLEEALRRHSPGP